MAMKLGGHSNSDTESVGRVGVEHVLIALGSSE
jgi:hypothetical protein